MVVLCLKLRASALVCLMLKVNCLIIRPLPRRPPPPLPSSLLIKVFVPRIFVLNSILVCEIVKYYNHIPNIDLLDQRGSLSCNEQINHSVKRSISSNNQKSISKTQKSHYFIIVAVSVWTVLTTMPYYLLNTYLLLLRIDLFENHFESDAITIAQIISSVFFNSNHCINFLIYLFFHAHFKGLLCKIFSKSSLKRISTYKNVENKELFDFT